MTIPHSVKIDYKDLTKIVRAFAASLYFAQGIQDPEGILPGTGKSAKDLAHDVLMVFIKGKSGWKSETGLNGAATVLKRVLKNDFLDLLKSSSYRTTAVLDSYTDGSESEHGATTKTLDDFPDPKISEADFYCPDAVLEAQRVGSAIKHDQALVEYVEAVLVFGASSRAQIARDLGIPVEEVDKRRKRLRTALAWYERNARAQRGD